MREDTEPTQAAQRYTAAHALHYGAKQLWQALESYKGIVDAYPDTREAEYAASQIHNIAKAVVPGQQLLAALAGLARSYLEHGAEPRTQATPLLPLAPGCDA